jgi:uncharacterized OB-fold protein
MIEADAPRILPELTEANTPFWTGGRGGQLLILHCDTCAVWVHPPTDECPACGGRLVPRAVSGTGTILTFTENHQQFHPDVTPPYVIAIVVLDEQGNLRLPTNVVRCDPAALRCGLPVHVLFERHGDIFVPLFEPILGDG